MLRTSLTVVFLSMLALVFSSVAFAASLPARVVTASPLGTGESSPCGSDRDSHGWEPEGWWEIRVCVRLSFRSSKYNLPAYLRALDRVDVSAEPVWTAETDDGPPSSDSVIRLIRLRSDVMPKTGTLPIRVAGRPYKLTLLPGKWQSGGPMHVRDVNVNLQLDDPDWIVLHSARFIPLQRPTSNLLEVIVENLSGVKVALSWLNVSATQEKGFACATGSRLPPLRPIAIDWPRVIAKAASLERLAGVTTTFAGAQVRVEATFRPASCSNDSEFDAKVPIATDVEVGGIARLVYRIDELHYERDVGFDRSVPASLALWNQVDISVEPSDRVLPLYIALSTSASGRPGTRRMHRLDRGKTLPGL